MDNQLSCIQHALLAVLAAGDGDTVAARRHVTQGQQQAHWNTRRDRQILEIVALAIAGQTMRAAGLGLEHSREFPNDAELVARLAPRNG